MHLKWFHLESLPLIQDQLALDLKGVAIVVGKLLVLFEVIG